MTETIIEEDLINNSEIIEETNNDENNDVRKSAMYTLKKYYNKN